MNKLSIILFCIIVFCQACQQDDGVVATCENCDFTCIDTIDSNTITNDCLDNYTCTFSVTNNSKVELEEYEGISNGDKIAFQLIYETEGSQIIIDDEITNVLVFELNINQNSFSVEDGSLENMNIHYKRICYCPDVKFRKPIKGCMQGELQSDGTWFVQGNLDFTLYDENVNISFEGQFTN